MQKYERYRAAGLLDDSDDEENGDY